MKRIKLTSVDNGAKLFIILEKLGYHWVDGAKPTTHYHAYMCDLDARLNYVLGDKDVVLDEYNTIGYVYTGSEPGVYTRFPPISERVTDLEWMHNNITDNGFIILNGGDV